MDKNKAVYQFVKQATTKSKTELAGSDTFYFHDNTVVGYNNIIGIQAKTEYPIQGSIKADKFYHLLDKISQDDITVKSNDKKVTIKYGNHVATIQKEQDGLKQYNAIIFPDTYNKMACPSDFLEALATSKFQHYSNKMSGIFVDDNIYYAMGNAGNISKYTSETGFGEVFWIPRDGVHLLLNVPEDIVECAISNSFFYAFTEHYTIAVKLKIANQFPLKNIEYVIDTYNDFTGVVTFPITIKDTLERVKLGTMKNTSEQFIFYMTTGEDLEITGVQKHSDGMMIQEFLAYEKHNIPKKTYMIEIASFLDLLFESTTMHIMHVQQKAVEKVVLATHTDKHTHLVIINEVI